MKCSEFEGMLDAYIDGELKEDARKEMQAHAAACEGCAKKLSAAEMLQDVLSHMDDSLVVPLETQAAWRRTVKNECKKKKQVRLYRIAGAVAAVVVLAVCVPTILKNNESADQAPVAYVEVDGVSETAQADLESAEPMLTSSLTDETKQVNAPAKPDAERRVAVEDVETAYGYTMDLVAEYMGTLESESTDADMRYVYVSVPAENAEDFIHAIDELGTPASDSYQNAANGDALEVCVCLMPE